MRIVLRTLERIKTMQKEKKIRTVICGHHKSLRLTSVLLSAALLLCCFLGFFGKAKEEGIPSSFAPKNTVLTQLTEPISVSAEQLQVKVADNTELKEYEGRLAVFVEAGNTVEFDVTVPEAGTYYLNLSYYQPDDVLMTTRAEVSVNGEIAQSDMQLPVWWENNIEYAVDEFGNELTHMPDRVYEWVDYTLNSSLYQYRDGIGFELEAGENHLEIRITETDLYIAGIALHGANETPAYEEWLKENPVTEETGKEAWIETIEGEQFALQSNAQIHAAKSKDSNLLPFDPAVNRVNALDGNSWSDAGDSVTWKFSVPEDGYYAIAVKYRQDDKEDLASYRHIYIDGEVPFSEFYSYGFAYTGNRNRNEVLSVDGETVYFYLSAGEHELRLETTAELCADANAAVRELVDHMNQVALSIREVTGGKADTDRDWNIERYVPGLRDELSEILVQMDGLTEMLTQLDGAEASLSTIQVAYSTIEKYLDQKDGLERLVNNLGSFAQASGSIAESISQLSEDLLTQPLMVDRLYIMNSAAEAPKANIGFFTGLWYEIEKLFLSFAVESSSTQSVSEDRLDVWVLGSAPQVETLKQIVAEEYGGGAVNISILQDETKLLLAIASGETPDVVLGGNKTKPYELGIRDAVYDLTQFSDFKAYASNFESEYFVPFIDGDAVYALPQTVNFYVMFYREDLLDSLGLSVPETWDEMIDMLPAIYRRGMTVNTTIANAGSIKPLVFTYPYISQYGGTLYSADGLETTLGNVETMQAFTLMTDLYTKYSLPVTVGNFYLSFRNGSVPMGMSDIGTYLLLRESSTEISGMWGLSAGLGVEQPDGTINNNYPVVASPCYILKESDSPETAWEFLKWWMDAETQLQYSEMLCATYGDTYLWLSANLEAIEGISSIPADDKAVILEQLQHVSEVPSHPASALFERALSNAWNQVVLSGKDTRTALDSAVIEESREIRRKLQELGYLDSDGNVLKPLEIADSEKAKELTGGTE